MIYSYMWKTNIPEYMYDSLFDDIVVDSILTNNKIEKVMIAHVTNECRHHHHRVSIDKVETTGYSVVDEIYMSCREDIYKLITALPKKFIENYCTDLEQDILINLIKYKSPKAVSRIMGVRNNLISQRIAGMKNKFKRYKQGVHIKLHNNIGDRYIIDDTKLSTDLRRYVSTLYKDGLSYKSIGEVVGRSTRIIAQIIYSIKVHPSLKTDGKIVH